MDGATEPEECFCARCAHHTHKTCCQDRELYLTPGDVRRIARHTGLTGFFTYEAPSNSEYADHDDDPAWAENVFRSDGTRRVLRRAEKGRCMFLGPAGCLLPIEIRPLVCRLFPYEYTEKGIEPELAGECPVELLRPGEDLIASLGMSFDDARRWHRQLYEEIRLERTPVRTTEPMPATLPMIRQTAARQSPALGNQQCKSA